MNYYYYNLLSAKKDPSKPTQNEVGKQTLMLGLDGDRDQHPSNAKRSTGFINKMSSFILMNSVIFKCFFCPSYRGEVKLSQLSKNSNLLFFRGLPVSVLSSSGSSASWELLPDVPEALPGSKDSAASRNNLSFPSSSKDFWNRS